MSTSTDPDTLSPIGPPAIGARLFGWISLGVLAAFFINNILNVAFGLPQVTGAWNGETAAWLLIAIYLIGIGAAALFVLRTPNRALRYDSKIISDFNAYLIRGCFFAVLFTGIVDAAIAFLRVEGLLEQLFSEALAKDLIRSRFIGPWVHGPLLVLGFVVAGFSRSLGFIWLALLIVLAELLIVFSRFVFSYEQAMMGDLVRYWYAALFLFASAYTLKEEGHVRVDVFFAGLSRRGKGKVNAIGTIFLGMVTAWGIIIVSMNGKQSIVNSAVTNFEVSQTGTAGMYTKYQMAAFLAVFAITMLIEFVSYYFAAVADTRDEPGKREAAPISH
ncbi:TRAP dicarboxylate transporter, DctQ subunit, unknown substrate 6 [Candidatus Rhodobacter oscarellae]|uniref:TRAP transporter small permease protein n=1 Tax=Candidatus Rhodobacter oscarellae TaxID=1675527 RepID=A0A0J9GRZ0_9RHOB|nr:TRAP transporter small permease subunit [Candidatus Rhodobacter lobularis]KMW56248.1 TRAP dicarboxylate transporter, DctQ subunit, unknown substrate 6 [Candidatus Rhodobacter lobularis]